MTRIGLKCLSRLGAIALAIAWFDLAEPVLADTAQPPPSLYLTGRGEVTAPPDIAIISIGVVRLGKTAREALNANNQAMADILEELRGQAIADKDLQTSGFSIQPRYSNSNDGRRNKIIGYQTVNQLSVTIRDLGKTGAILDTVVSLGSNQINGIRYSIADPAPLRDQARALAAQDALRKAKIYAQAAGFELGDILSMRETGHQRPPVYARQARSAALESAAAVPTAEGEQSISVQVEISWEISQ